jgi:hypothetical protein
VRQAPLWNGHQAYMLLHDGFVFSGPQNATVLMAQLSNMRFLQGETGSAFCLRLIELLEELEHVPGSAAVVLNDTQKIGYLLSAIRHESDLAAVYVQLQTDQLRGKVTFEQACQELHFRCEAIRADNLLDTQFKPTKALISTEIKHVHKAKLPCLVQEWSSLFFRCARDVFCSANQAKFQLWSFAIIWESLIIMLLLLRLIFLLVFRNLGCRAIGVLKHPRKRWYFRFALKYQHWLALHQDRQTPQRMYRVLLSMEP